MIDLHCHSQYSDGSLSPENLLLQATQQGVTVLALTDHDTVSGLVPLHEAALKHHAAITLINGIEFSTQWKKTDIHLIGLRINPEARIIQSLVAKQHAKRFLRARKIADQLAPLGITDLFEKAHQLATNDNLSRPHFAQVLLNEGRVRTFQGAFTQYLGRGKVGYAPTAWVPMDELIDGIKEAGGQAVLAHPMKYGVTQTKFREMLDTFKQVGGEGVEVVSGLMEPQQIRQMAALCQRYDLLASTGSDFHSEELSRIKLGQQASLPLHCTPIWHQWNLRTL